MLVQILIPESTLRDIRADLAAGDCHSAGETLERVLKLDVNKGRKIPVKVTITY